MPGSGSYVDILTQAKFTLDLFGFTPYVMAFLVVGVVVAIYDRFFNKG